MPTKSSGDVLTSALWNTYVRDNIDKLLSRGHRVLTVAQFAALTGPEGTKGTVAPDEVYLEVDATNGIQWHLAYESGEPTYKWRFLGGPPLQATVTASETTTATSPGDLATVGPSITLPRGGDYAADWSVALGANVVPTNLLAPLTKNNVVQQNLQFTIGTAGISYDVSKFWPVNAAAADVIKVRYSVNANTGTFQARILRIVPVRIA
jgi:opacity protein-like surface antigen